MLEGVKEITKGELMGNTKYSCAKEEADCFCLAGR